MSIKKLWNRLVKEKITKFRQDWVLQFRTKQAEQAKQTGRVKQVEKVEKTEKTEKLCRLFRLLSYFFAVVSIVGVGRLFCCTLFSVSMLFFPLVSVLASTVFSVTYNMLDKVELQNLSSAMYLFFGKLLFWGFFLFMFSLLISIFTL